MPSRFACRVLILFSLLVSGLSFVSCGGGSNGSGGSISIENGVFGPNVWGTPDTFRGAGIIHQDPFLFGGPITRGRQGDILLQNDKIRVIIQKPTRTAGVGLFGGNIIDADRFRLSSEPGQDQFGVIYPLINLGWTVNYQRLEIINADFANGPVVLRATGMLDVYDYIQTSIIVPFAKIFTGADLFYDDQFDDVLDPFEHGIQTFKGPDNKAYTVHLRDLSPVIVTDYTLSQDSEYVIMETKFQNNGEHPIKMPVGDWVNGSGTLELMVPKQGFVRTARVDASSALVYQAMEDDVSVSYGYFYNPIQLTKEDGTLPKSASLSVSGVTPMVLGEEGLLNVLPLKTGDTEPQVKINFSIEPGVRTLTRYFVVGTGDAASVLDAGFKALGISKMRVSGKVIDQGGNPVPRARVVVLEVGETSENTVTVAFSDAAGNFGADISTGRDAKDQIFGNGSYKLEVYKEGYAQGGSSKKSGVCTGGSLDAAAYTFSGVTCKLGGSGIVNLSVSADGAPGPARVTIVGHDPSPIHDYVTPENFGKYHDDNIEERPYGIVDLLYLDPSGKLFPEGNMRRVSDTSIRLEPGEYEIFFTRGLEYSVDKHRITVGAGGSVAVHGTIQKVLDTSGYVSGDFHIHGIQSPDSPYRMESRIRAAMAEGLDILTGTDHEYVTDYDPMIQSLGYGNWQAAFSGDEITPLAYGHMITWPLTPDTSKTDNGAYDYTYVPSDDTLGPEHDMVQNLDQIIQGVDQSNPGTQVFSIAHITDKALGVFSIAKMVSSPAFGVEPFSTYSDPVNFRLPANTNASGGYQAPFPLGSNSMITTNFTSLGLTISTFKDILEHLTETSLPIYFNILNLGKICSATGDSDTHSQIREPLGIPRNFIESSVDPRDGVGSFAEIDQEEIAVNVNAGKVIVTNGIFLRARLKSAANPAGVSVGGTISGTGDVTLELEITSNEYFDWDTVEVYGNTIPVPAKDDMSGPTDLGVEDFHTATSGHIQKYLIAPLARNFRGGSGDEALSQTVSGGVRKATVTRAFSFSEDTWVIVLVKGGKGTAKSTFPYVTKEANTEIAPANFLDTLDSNRLQIKGIPAFAFTNPMFVDVDGNGFQSIYVRDGTSPLAK